jgi:hypothetical protein
MIGITIGEAHIWILKIIYILSIINGDKYTSYHLLIQKYCGKDSLKN